MSHPEEYNLVVLGSGRARSFAWSLASQGKRVAAVERRNLAGSCPTIACAPSKNVIHGAKVANYFRAGPKDAPAVLLLPGFPTSSQMFRNLIPAPWSAAIPCRFWTVGGGKRRFIAVLQKGGRTRLHNIQQTRRRTPKPGVSP